MTSGPTPGGKERAGANSTPPRKQAALEEPAPSSRMPPIEEGDPRHVADADGNESLARKRAAREASRQAR